MATKTDDEVILKLWGWGWSKGQIAQALHLTRGQVSGKLFRAGAPKRDGQRLPLVDLTGQRFGWLTVLDRAACSRTGMTRWRCRCACGTIKILHANNIRSGRTRSCGCALRAYSPEEVAA